jgi:hypothetical protein
LIPPRTQLRENPDPSKSYTDAYAYDPSSLDNNNNQAGPSSYNYNNNLPSTHNNNNNNNAAGGGNPNNVWEASIGFLRVDVLAGLGYLGGPITGESSDVFFVCPFVMEGRGGGGGGGRGGSVRVRELRGSRKGERADEVDFSVLDA